MRFLKLLLLCTVALCAWHLPAALHASPATDITVVGHLPGTKFTSITTGATLPFYPLAEARANGLNHPPPSPGVAATKKFHGTVELRVESDPSGNVRKATVVHPCGSPLLDEIARSWVQYVWRYPAADRSRTHSEQVRFDITAKDVANAAKARPTFRSQSSSSPPPPYPGVAIYNGWQGAVRLRLAPDGSGGVKEAKIITTNAAPLLSLSAQAWCEAHWQLSGNEPVDCSITFQLR